MRTRASALLALVTARGVCWREPEHTSFLALWLGLARASPVSATRGPGRDGRGSGACPGPGWPIDSSG